MAINGDVEPVMEYQTGKKVRWLLFGDILWLIHSSNKLKDIPEFLKYKGITDDILSWDDPMPTIGMLKYGLKSFFFKERRKHVFQRGW